MKKEIENLDQKLKENDSIIRAFENDLSEAYLSNEV